MSRHEFWCLVCLANIDPAKFGGRNHLVSALQIRGMRKKYGSTPTTTVSSRREIEKKRKDRKRKLDKEKSIVTRNIASNETMVIKTPRVNDDALQTGGALDRQLNHDKPHWPIPVKYSGVSYQLC